MATVTIALEPYIMKTLMRDLVGHDRRPAAFLLYLHLAANRRRGGYRASLADLAYETGLSKRAIQLSIAHLERRALIEVARAGATATPVFFPRTPWRRR